MANPILIGYNGVTDDTAGISSIEFRAHTCNRDNYFTATNATSFIDTVGFVCEIAVATVVKFGIYEVDVGDNLTPDILVELQEIGPFDLLGGSVQTVVEAFIPPIPLENGKTYAVAVMVDPNGSTPSISSLAFSSVINVSNASRTGDEGVFTMPSDYTQGGGVSNNRLSIFATGFDSLGLPALTGPLTFNLTRPLTSNLTG